MSKKFIIGDRTKDEWISVLDTEKKKLEFTNHIATAETGYFQDLQVYVKDEDGRAYRPNESDAFHM